MRKSTICIFILISLNSFSNTSCETKYNLLSSPKPLSDKAVKECILNPNFSFKFDFKDGSSLSILHSKGTTGLKIELCKEDFLKLTKAHKKLFKWKKDVSEFDYHVKPNASATVEMICPPLEKTAKDNEITKITAKELASIVSTNKVLFYTGAGISALKIPTMPKIISILQLNENPKATPVVTLVRTILADPEKYLEPMHQVFLAFVNCEPTPAHWKIKQVCLTTNNAILTENMDLLHAYTGIDAPIVYASKIKSEVTAEILKSIDFIICLGMSKDNRGLLAWYKKHNPNGRLIAVNIEIPQFLGKEDMIILQDIQTVLPAIEKQVTTRFSLFGWLGKKQQKEDVLTVSPKLLHRSSR